MADELKTKKITDLEENTTIDDTDILMAGDKGTNALKRFTVAKLFDAIKTKIAGWAFDTLTTTDKTLLGAVNELNSNMTKIKIIGVTVDNNFSTEHDLRAYISGNLLIVHGRVKPLSGGTSQEMMTLNIESNKIPSEVHKGFRFCMTNQGGSTGTGYMDLNGEKVKLMCHLPSNVSDSYVFQCIAFCNV